MTYATTSRKEIKSLLVPMQQKPLLLPIACLAEVIDYPHPDKTFDKNENWYLGDITWRGLEIPLVSFERFNHSQFNEVTATARIAVMNRTTETSKHGFYGMIIQGVPQPLTLSKGDVQPSNDQPGPAEMSLIVVKDLPAIIPDLEELEQKLTTLA